MWPSAQPATPPAGPPPLTVPNRGTATPTDAPGAQKVLTTQEVGVWHRRATAALEATKDAIEIGKVNVQRYTGKYLTRTPTDDTVLVPTDFYNIEAKRSKLFYRLPDVFVKAEQPGLDDACVVFQAALNKKLGPAGVNVLPTVQQVIFDVLCPTGFGAVVVGFQTAIGDPPEIPMQVGMEPDPTAPPQPSPPGSVLGLQPPAMRPIMQPAPNIVARWYFAEHIRPGDLLVPPDFVGTDFDKATWIGQKFREDVLDADAQGADQSSDDRRLTPLPASAQSAGRKQRVGYELWYRAHLFDSDVQHPDKIRTFKLYEDDLQGEIVVRDHPHQRYADASGKLQAGMRGYPISPLTLRYVSDTWMAPSDCTMARNTADELSKGRTQMIRSRDRNLPQWGFDATRVDKDKQAAIEKNEIQGGIPFNGPGQDATWPIQKGGAPRETYQFNDVAQADLQKIWRLGLNQVGVLDDKSRTATEQQLTASSAQEAGEADRSIVLDWYVNKIVAKFATLLQLYADEPEFVELIGTDAQRLEKIPPNVQQQAQQVGQDAHTLIPWNKDMIQGLFAFSAKPNSQLFLDVAQETKRMMDTYQFFANSPNVNRAEMERQILARQGYDPSRIMQQPPPRSSAPPQVSLSVKGEDLSPLSPQSAILLDAMSKLGVPIDPAAIQEAKTMAASLVPPPPVAQPIAGALPQMAHGGAVAPVEPLSKHPVEQTHGMQGTGAHAPMGAGGLH